MTYKPLFEVVDVLTGVAADLRQLALKEDWARNLVYRDMEGFAVDQDGALILMDGCGNVANCPMGRFEIIWYGDPRERVKV